MTCPCKKKPRPLDAPRALLKPPTASCLYCTEKHLGTASALAREMGYEAPNLGYIVGELVAAAWHLAAGGPERQALAEKIRDFRHAIQRREIRPGDADFAPFLREIDRLIAADLAAGEKASASPEKIPLLVPLAYRPDVADHELKILLRSAVANARGLGEIIVATGGPPPPWLKEGNGLRVLPMSDPAPHNKDENLARKVAAMLEAVAPAREAVWCADDNVFLHPVDLATMPILRNERTAESLRAQEKRCRWENRLLHTLECYPRLWQNYDTHTPQRVPREAAIAAIRRVPWEVQPGRTLGTALIGELYPAAPPPSETQAKWKETAESAEEGAATPLTHRFLGYCDPALAPLLPRLYKLFPNPSPWEK